ncbi:hypothetical protein [Mycolicibacterium gilvum]|uniref:hypothetical protein n=1 Tax=Mycolicibacterium gilvum TaxID=1804 RepID=UPI00155886CE|nr:hypothetical protein [Mycolicibacterium gilvum]
MGSQSDPLAQEPKTPPVSVSGRQRLNLMAVVGERLMILSPLVDTAVLPVVALRTVVLRLARRSIGRVALLAGFSIGRPQAHSEQASDSNSSGQRRGAHHSREIHRRLPSFANHIEQRD